MADNKTGLNAQYDPGNSLFGVSVPDGSGAPGSAGISAAATAGPVIGSPAVSTPYASSQVPGNMPSVPVHSGDTSAMADDLAAHSSAIVAAPQDALLNTGAGAGSTHMPNPNAGR